MAKTKEVREGNRPGLRKNRTPRVLFAIEDVAPKPKSTSKKSSVPKTKANTSKPRAKAATAGRVEKKKAPATKSKRTPTVTDKVKGVVEKAVGTIEGKPAKKVCCFHSSLPSKSWKAMLMSTSLARLTTNRLTVTSRLPARRRPRALMERDLSARRKLRRTFATYGSSFHRAEMVETTLALSAHFVLPCAACTPLCVFLQGKLGAGCDDGLGQWRVCYNTSLVYISGEGRDESGVAACPFTLEMYDTLWLCSQEYLMASPFPLLMYS